MITKDAFAGTKIVDASLNSVLFLNSVMVTDAAAVPLIFDISNVFTLNTVLLLAGLTNKFCDVVVKAAATDLPVILLTFTIFGAAIFFSVTYS